VIPAMAAATKSLGFGVTVATTYEQPYHLARRLSTVDHLTKGRVGWNIVTGYLDSAARNLGHTEQPEHDERQVINATMLSHCRTEHETIGQRLTDADTPSLKSTSASCTSSSSHPGVTTPSF
jgi:hypothetical protein